MISYVAQMFSTIGNMFYPKNVRLFVEVQEKEELLKAGSKMLATFRDVKLRK